MKAYCDRRAPEYDAWYFGLGRFDGLQRQHWDDDLHALLNDRSYWEVYKRYFTGDELSRKPGGGEILHESRWFVVVLAGE